MANINENIVSPFIVFIDNKNGGKNKIIKIPKARKKSIFRFEININNVPAYIDNGSKTLYSIIPNNFSEYL